MKVTGNLDIAAASETARCLREALAAPGEGALEIDLSGIGECDVMGLQLLLAAEKSAAARGRGLAVAAPAAAVTEACRAAGIDPAWIGVTTLGAVA